MDVMNAYKGTRIQFCALVVKYLLGYEREYSNLPDNNSEKFYIRAKYHRGTQ